MKVTAHESPVKRVAIFRALMVGDILCATPALRAIRMALPEAQISLIGLPWAQEFVSRCAYLDEWITFPGWPGLTEQPFAPEKLPVFLRNMQRRSFDLTIQLHGSGGITNPLVAAFGAHANAGFYGPDAWLPPSDSTRFLPWPRKGNEIDRLLALCLHLKFPASGRVLDFPIFAKDFDALKKIWPAMETKQPYVCIHPGAQLPSRRWPVQRFAVLADRCANAGFTVVLTGTTQEAILCAELESCMRTACVNLAGCTSLWTLGALIQRAKCLLCNDTGVSHIAAAVQTPSVVVSSGGDPERWAPLDRQLHIVLSKSTPCRPCAHAYCPTAHECAQALTEREVWAAVEGQLGIDRNHSQEDVHHVSQAAHTYLARTRELSIQPDASAS